jgi:hypothetical protein
MKFEEILPLLREGKKARHGRMKAKEYWICGTASMPGMDKWPTLIKVFDNPFENERLCDKDSWAWGIERWAILCDSWEIVDE